ncbi:MAG: rhomboid family intramembrane serine protease [Pseudomonadales bacterium]|jgi:membrane associated rhomboid family serine protease|nr:rhomboid family intramembrane serine protease [Pseudomonadales bacterium]
MTKTITSEERLISKIPFATLGLVALLSLIFFTEISKGAVPEVTFLLNFGSITSALIGAGEWQRLFLGTWLHLSVDHYLGNIAALLVFGSIIEKFIGWKRLLTIYLMSGIGGALASYWGEPGVIAVGASGAIYGVIGAGLWLQFFLHHKVFIKYGVVYVLVVSIALPMIVPQIDWKAHVGGFVTGVLAAWLLCRSLQDKEHQSALTKALACLVVLYLVAFVSFYVLVSTGKAQKNLLTLLEDGKLKPDTINTFSWFIAVDNNSTLVDLNKAVSAMRPIVDAPQRDAPTYNSTTQAAYVDTYAVLLHRLGKLADAVIYMRKALLLVNKGLYRGRFAEFMQEYYEKHGILTNGNVTNESVTLETALLENGKTKVEIKRNEADGNLAVVLMVYRETEIVGYYVCQFLHEDAFPAFYDKEDFGISAAELSYKLTLIDSLNYLAGDNDLCRKVAK